MPARFPIAVLAAALALAVAAAPAGAGPRSSAKFPETLPGLRGAPDAGPRGGRIVDARGREVLLRGVNVNVLADYAQRSSFPPVAPFLPRDLALLRAGGWNLVRLQLSWSRIEPSPGRYDEAYLAEAERYVETFRSAGMYTILDLHQDAWSASLGGDGAPGWATLFPAVPAAWSAFWADAPGPDGVGIRTRYVAMLAHLARRLARHDSVAGYDVMNEPAAFTAEHQAALADLYGDALRAIRAGERVAGAPPRLVLFQRPGFPRERDAVYAPHVHALTRAAFQAALAEAHGAPVLIGEWGPEPDRGLDHTAHQDLQDAFALGSALWAWRESCGIPARVADGRPVRGLYDVDCATNTTIGLRRRLVRRLMRAYVRAAPGRLHGQRYSSTTGRFAAAGAAPRDNRETLLVFYPGAKHPGARFRARGLDRLRAVRVPGEGRFVVAVPRGSWSLEIGPRLASG